MRIQIKFYFPPTYIRIKKQNLNKDKHPKQQINFKGPKVWVFLFIDFIIHHFDKLLE